jgi:hypothetical protein
LKHCTACSKSARGISKTGRRDDRLELRELISLQRKALSDARATTA